MRAVLVVSLLLLAGILSTYSCKKKLPVVTEVLPASPYPPLAEQRATLAAKPWVTPTRILDSAQIIADLEYFASDACEGRKPGTEGHARAMERIVTRMQAAGVDSFDQSLVQIFLANGNTTGKNVVGWLKGTTYPDKYIVVTAHYDHLGKAANGETFYGADDNASGAACLLALASYFKKNPHAYSLIFAALDKEETGLEGAHNLVAHLQKTGRLAAVAFNLNMDMIARSDNNEIFASGISHYPAFMYAVTEVQAKTNVKVLMGHDGGAPDDDWTAQSDHAAFHQKNIPFLYIGVEDHPDYHKTTDTYGRINYSRYIENCNMVALMTQALKP